MTCIKKEGHRFELWDPNVSNLDEPPETVVIKCVHCDLRLVYRGMGLRLQSSDKAESVLSRVRGMIQGLR